MGKFDENSGRSVVELSGKSAGGGGGTLFSAAALGRKLIGVLMCGGVYRSCGRGKRGKGKWRGDVGPAPPLPTESKMEMRFERLWEVLESEMSDLELDEMCATEEETRRRTEALAELQGVVRRLHSYEGAGISERDALRKEAAMELRRLAKDDAAARETLAMLGAIPPLVEMLDSDEVGLQVASLYALLNLGIGNNANKSAIVAVGAVHKMVKIIGRGSVPWSVSEAVVANFLALSALDANKHLIGSSGAVPFLVETFRVVDPLHAQARLDAIRALFNLAIAPENVPCLVDAGLVPDLLAAIGDMSVSEKVLPVLSSVVSTVEGRTAVIRTPEAFHILVDVLNWSDSPRCQEEAAYVLMVMVHKSYSDRTGMIEAGIVSSLLELTLVGTALAQKRAAGILECLRAEGEEQISEGFPGAPAVAAPLTGTRAEGGPPETTVEEEPGMCEERRAVNQLVQQSMLDTTRRILRRANLPPDLSPSGNLCAPSVHSTVSKSLPF
ncbi:unnamed protein product [Spirodela intermedia]|uniref:U-box domain-containing protein n=1 Tax=Spirodela intermedia TaxID=51605 RepID=A0A7I8LBQ9_SPIIN|nr:unnamed protein product [Spirodela intermedia]